MARSEENAIVGKVTYTELNLTNYPDVIDTRDNNQNMSGYANIKDFNYAEHVNALADAVMALQRAIGVRPYIDKDSINHETVSERMLAIENKDYDIRYGGAGWDESQTIVGHTHTGGPGHPGQVNLASEVKGVLGTSNIDLDPSSGLTGGDISVSKLDSRKIPDALNDKLSLAQGGVIQKNLEVKGQFATKLYRDYDATNRSAGQGITDYTSLSNQIARGSGTEVCQFFTTGVNNLLYGKFVLAVRVRVNTQVAEDVLVLRWHDFKSGVWQVKSEMFIKGNELPLNQWQTVYMLFDHDGDNINSYGSFHVWKPYTSQAVNVDIDCVYIMPTHPAVYDK